MSWTPNSDRTQCEPLGFRRPTSACASREQAVSWAVELDLLARRRQERMQAHAVAVVTSHGARHRAQLFFSESARAVSIGRHEGCMVNGVHNASLRHALVALWPGAERPLEVLDLRSRNGLGTRRIRAHAACRFLCGDDEVTVLYAPPLAEFPSLPDDLDVFIASEHPHAAAPISNHSVIVGALNNDARFDRDGVAYVRATPEELRAGLLLGRYDRCDQHVLLWENVNVSRVHALLFEREGTLYVVDVGSTNGTHVFRWTEPNDSYEVERGVLQALRDDEGVEIGGSRLVVELITDRARASGRPRAGRGSRPPLGNTGRLPVGYNRA